jgi:hypothetical protein
MLISAPWAEPRLLLRILVCKSLLQTLNLMQRLVPRWGFVIVNIGHARGCRLWISNPALQTQAFRQTRCKKIFHERSSVSARRRGDGPALAIQ